MTPDRFVPYDWEHRGREHFVYAHIAADGSVLYVGRTRNIGARTKRHRYGSPWWPLVERVATLKRCANFHEARVAERALIALLDPPHNVQFTSRATA